MSHGKYRYGGTFDTLEEAQEAEEQVKRRIKAAAKGTKTRRARQDAVTDYWLYRCYDSDGSLLYVGITSEGVRRFRRHGNKRDWWSEVAEIKIDHHPTRQAAMVAERDAIWKLSPQHNRDPAAVEQTIRAAFDAGEGALPVAEIDSRLSPQVSA